MTSSVNGKEVNTTQWNRNDEVEECSPPEGAPSSKVSSRPRTFCKDITMLENLNISGDVIIGGNVTIAGELTVGGTITAPFFNGTAAKAVVASSLG